MFVFAGVSVVWLLAGALFYCQARGVHGKAIILSWVTERASLCGVQACLV
jgi:hypothetical protein